VRTTSVREAPDHEIDVRAAEPDVVHSVASSSGVRDATGYHSVGADRMRVANERAMKENIKQFMLAPK